MSVENMSVLSDSDLTENLNMAKDALIQSLIKDGVIDESKVDSELLCSNYVLVVKRKNLFGKIYDKIMNTTENNSYITVLRTNQKFNKE